MKGSDIITSVGIILTFSLGIFNLMINIKNSKKTQFINTVTAARIKWIQELRDLISQFVSYVPFYGSSYIWQDGKERGDYTKNLIELKEKIKLHLNINDERDKRILDLLEDIVKLTYMLYEECIQYVENDEDKKFDEIAKMSKDEIESLNVSVDKLKSILRCYGFLKNLREEIPKLTQQLTVLIQEYLKNEWERVKQESKNGDLIDTLDNRKWLRLKDMLHFKELKNWILLKRIYEFNLVLKIKILIILLLIIILIIA